MCLKIKEKFDKILIRRNNCKKVFINKVMERYVKIWSTTIKLNQTFLKK